VDAHLTKDELQKLWEACQALPKHPRETAVLGWTDQNDWRLLGQTVPKVAGLYLQEATQLVEAEKAPPPSWGDVQRDLEGIKEAASCLVERLTHLHPESLDLIQNVALEASTKRPNEHTEGTYFWTQADGYAWFPVARCEWSGGHDYGWPEPCEPEYGHDGMREWHLTALCRLMDILVRDAVVMKEQNNGHRTARPQDDPVFNLMLRLCEMTKTLARPKMHALKLGQMIHAWYDGDPVGDQWGRKPWERAWTQVWGKPQSRCAHPHPQPDFGEPF